MTAQHLQALELANAVRYDRAAIRRQVHAAGPDGRQLVADLLDGGDGVVASMPVLRLLMWPQRMGQKGAVRMLRQVGVVSELRLVRDLTGRQRRSLAATLRGGSG